MRQSAVLLATRVVQATSPPKWRCPACPEHWGDVLTAQDGPMAEPSPERATIPERLELSRAR
jgi:hypothetical protein